MVVSPTHRVARRCTVVAALSLVGISASFRPAAQAADEAKAEAPPPVREVREEAPPVGLWIQQDSGGVLDIRANGRIEGFPVRGTWRTGDRPNRIKIFSGGSEVLDCDWEAKSPDAIALTRKVDGETDTVMLFRLKPATMALSKWKGKFVIMQMAAAKKSATIRSVVLDDQGYFRTEEGGFYLRLALTEQHEPVAYSSGQEDITRGVKLWAAGRYLVIADRLEKPNILASCLRVEGDVALKP